MDIHVLTKKFAEAVSYGADLVDREEIEIATDQDAVAFCLENNKLYFQTWEISHALINGEEYHTDPKNHSERRYVGLSSLYEKSARVKQMGEELELMRNSLDELNLEMEKAGITALDDEKVEQRDRMIIEYETLQDQRLELENDGKKPAFVNINENAPDASKPEYIPLNEGEIVYNTKGQKIWPAPH